MRLDACRLPLAVALSPDVVVAGRATHDLPADVFTPLRELAAATTTAAFAYEQPPVRAVVAAWAAAGRAEASARELLTRSGRARLAFRGPAFVPPPPDENVLQVTSHWKVVLVGGKRTRTAAAIIVAATGIVLGFALVEGLGVFGNDKVSTPIVASSTKPVSTPTRTATEPTIPRPARVPRSLRRRSRQATRARRWRILQRALAALGFSAGSPDGDLRAGYAVGRREVPGFRGVAAGRCRRAPDARGATARTVEAATLMALRSRDTWTGYAPLDAKLRVQFQAAVSDIREGLRRWRSWSYLSVENVKNRYRRTVFGPWWLTLQMVILVGGISIVFGQLLNTDLKTFVPYVGLGYIAFSLLSGLTSTGAVVFIAGSSTLKSTRQPLSNLVLRDVGVEFINFAHNMVIYLVFLVIGFVPLSPEDPNRIAGRGGHRGERVVPRPVARDRRRAVSRSPAFCQLDPRSGHLLLPGLLPPRQPELEYPERLALLESLHVPDPCVPHPPARRAIAAVVLRRHRDRDGDQCRSRARRVHTRSFPAPVLGGVMAEIRLGNVRAQYELLSVLDYSIKRRVVETIRRKAAPPVTIDALSGVDLEVPDGTRLGLVGANGAGKSTLLAIMAGVLPPTSGSVQVHGRVLALLGGAGEGLDQEATGRDNIVSLGVQLGETPAAMRRRIDDVTEFSGLAARIDHPVYSYSTGMQARLRFSILTSLRPDILLLDEGLGTADAEFAHRADERLREFMSSAGIVVLASHGDDLLRSQCDTAVWLDQGRVREQGELDTVLANYHASYVRDDADNRLVTS